LAGIAYPEQLTILANALQEYCRLAHIQPGTSEHHDAGRLIWVLFESGISDPGELARALRASRKVWSPGLAPGLPSMVPEMLAYSAPVDDRYPELPRE
jgi:hypothetical protein